MLNVLIVIGWILLCLLIVVVWVLVVPRSVIVEYTNADSLVVKVRVLFFKIKVYPLPKIFTGKKEKQKKDKKTADANGKASVDKKQKKPSAFKTFMEDMPKGFELVKEVFATVKGTMAILLKGVKIKDVSFTVPVCAKDAFETQKLYGTVTTAFYSLSIFLQKYVKIFYKKPIFVADFANLYKDSTYFYCKIQASPSIILVVGWYLFRTYRRLTKANQNNSDKEI